MQILPIGGLANAAGVPGGTGSSGAPGSSGVGRIVRLAPGQPVQATRGLEGAAEHDPKLCEHCLAGARHEFSADGDEVVVSAEARAKGDGEAATRPQGLAGAKGADGETLTEEELGVVRELAARDREVRAHEQAHLAAAGAYATSGPTYSYQTGPDGQRYAVGGEVGIDTSPVPGNPEATLSKARTIMAAANAPAEPSAQDRAVAAAAASMMAQAQAELARAAAVAQYSRGETTAGATVSLAA
ncbi:MAG: hypothetical protein J0L64_12560 [Acidobacteria bacterium]|nr:hypothetical protein [Acidobacteriota bacterium]